MSEFFATFAVPSLIGLFTFLLIRRASKKKKPKRLPCRAISPQTAYRAAAVSSRLPSSSSIGVRKPHRADDREYMNYRNCPDCHSENEINHQVIFKVSPHHFVCTVCGSRFEF